MSSYLNNELDYLDIFKIASYLIKPKKIVEFGILDGTSLKVLLENNLKAKIYAYDIFDEFNGNSANINKLKNKFKNYKNLTIKKGNFFSKFNRLKDNSIDLLHIDIANDGLVFNFFIDHYFKKLRKNGIAILEGGSVERDNVKWMKKYNKVKITKSLIKIKKKKYNFIKIGRVPSVTIFKK